MLGTSFSASSRSVDGSECSEAIESGWVDGQEQSWDDGGAIMSDAGSETGSEVGKGALKREKRGNKKNDKRRQRKADSKEDANGDEREDGSLPDVDVAGSTRSLPALGLRPGKKIGSRGSSRASASAGASARLQPQVDPWTQGTVAVRASAASFLVDLQQRDEAVKLRVREQGRATISAVHGGASTHHYQIFGDGGEDSCDYGPNGWLEQRGKAIDGLVLEKHKGSGSNSPSRHLRGHDPSGIPGLSSAIYTGDMNALAHSLSLSAVNPGQIYPNRSHTVTNVNTIAHTNILAASMQTRGAPDVKKYFNNYGEVIDRSKVTSSPLARPAPSGPPRLPLLRTLQFDYISKSKK